MGLFFPSDPVIHGQRATGLPRYQELLERDWKSFLFADFVTLGLCIPYHSSQHGLPLDQQIAAGRDVVREAVRYYLKPSSSDILIA